MDESRNRAFLSLLELAPVEDGGWTVPPPPDKGDSTFGGQFLAQCLAAAHATLDADRAVHSLHAYFLRPGDVDLPTHIEVEAVRDGRSFSSRQAVARQQGKEVFRMTASFQVPGESPEYTDAGMPQVPPPEQVSFTYDDFTLQQTGEGSWYGSDRPMDIRYINPPGARGEPVTEPQRMWMRIDATLPDDPRVHHAGLAYLSDSTLVDHIMLPLGRRWQDEGFLGTSLDHAMWFHRFARADEWLLFEQNVETTGSGRGLASGRFFDRSGKLVATCVQEGLMRWLK